MSKRRQWKNWEWTVFRIYMALMFFILEQPFVDTLKIQYLVYSSNSITSEPRNEKELVVQKLINEFIDEAKLRNIEIDSSNLTFSFSKDLSPSSVIDFNKSVVTVGQCNTTFSHIKVLDNDVLYLLSDKSFKATLYHELGHCLLGLAHDETELTVPNLMNSIVFEDHEDWVYLKRNNPKTWTLSVDYLFEKYQNHVSQK